MADECGLSEIELKLIEQLRQEFKDDLPEYYDTDFNLIRWIKAYGGDMIDVKRRLRRHLLLRDSCEIENDEPAYEIQNIEIYENYIPIGIVGPVGKDNKILLMVPGGRVDFASILHCIQCTSFILYRARILNKLQKMIMEQEMLTNKQSGAIQIFDLEGLKMTPSLIPVLTGPLRIMWSHCFDNFPELLTKVIVVNTPTFINILWSAIKPFMPQLTKDKIIIAGSNWKEVLLEYVDEECLPVHWGGKMIDSNGDEMCRDRVIIPPGKIPKELYWKPKPGNPTMDDLTQINVRAGSKVYIGYFVSEADTTIEWFVQCSQNYTFGIYYSENPKLDPKQVQMEEVFADYLYCGMTTIDDYQFRCKKAGAYHIKFGNEGAWFWSIALKYSIRFSTKQGEAVKPILLSS